MALLGRNSPVGIAFGALLFGFLDRAAIPLQFADIPASVVTIIQGTIVLSVVVANEVARRMARRRAESGGAVPPPTAGDGSSPPPDAASAAGPALTTRPARPGAPTRRGVPVSTAAPPPLPPRRPRAAR